MEPADVYGELLAQDHCRGLQFDVQCRDDDPAPGCVGAEERSKLPSRSL